MPQQLYSDPLLKPDNLQTLRLDYTSVFVFRKLTPKKPDGRKWRLNLCYNLRVLDRGDTGSIKWLLNNYSKDEIENTIMKSRDLSQKTANFWADLYNMDRTKILCLQKHYSPIQFGLSS